MTSQASNVELISSKDEIEPPESRHKRAEIMARIRQQKKAEDIARTSRRDKWKAASANYYARHPEVKEKKRLKTAERRAATRAAKRRWDPPKKTKRDEQLGDFSETPDLDLSENFASIDGLCLYGAAT
ncbi:hypothetical protein C8F04DRAFT_1174700 [Mycena alexandri]|uniref:Uncharacterized protein n=1 Tax=Mycena alexandri TaxID=1745969 RepID=A0AAD6XGC5_9AGAR|nr:hypothetical protein C8F04DRAFT_1174700 [Mycena alexandri]